MTEKNIAESHRKKLQAFVDGKKSVAELAVDLKVTKVTVYRWLDVLGMKDTKKRVKRRVRKNGAKKAAAQAIAPTNGAVEAVEPPVREFVSRSLYTVTDKGVTLYAYATTEFERAIVCRCAMLAGGLIEKFRASPDVETLQMDMSNSAESYSPLEHILVHEVTS